VSVERFDSVERQGQIMNQTGSKWLFGVLASLSILAPAGRLLAQAPPCVSCYNNQSPMAGNGPVSPTDNRRVINVFISAKWNTPNANTTNPLIWNAAACAVQQWNTTTDGNGRTTGYYFVVNQSNPSAFDIDITNAQASTTGGGTDLQTSTATPARDM
jgi:hypothetical protein